MIQFPVYKEVQFYALQSLLMRLNFRKFICKNMGAEFGARTLLPYNIFIFTDVRDNEHYIFVACPPSLLFSSSRRLCVRAEVFSIEFPLFHRGKIFLGHGVTYSSLIYIFLIHVLTKRLISKQIKQRQWRKYSNY